MKYIKKTSEPSEFIAWKQSNTASIQAIGNDAKLLWKYWDGNSHNVKDLLKNKLCEDQGSICCYCNQLIPATDNDRTEIEHLSPKTLNPQVLTFDFNNLLLSCHGDRGTKEMHCNSKKDSDVLPITPLTVDCHKHFVFTKDGRILGNDEDAKKTVVLLGLFARKLKLLREAAIDEELEQTKTKQVAETRVLALQNENSPFTPFSIAIISVLKDEFNLP